MGGDQLWLMTTRYLHPVLTDSPLGRATLRLPPLTHPPPPQLATPLVGIAADHDPVLGLLGAAAMRVRCGHDPSPAAGRALAL